MARYYVHTASDTPAALQHTFVYEVDEDSSAIVHDLITAFLDDFRAVHPTVIVTLSDSSVTVTNASNEPLSVDDRLSSCIEDRDDVFIAIQTQLQPSTSPSPLPLVSEAATIGKDDTTSAAQSSLPSVLTPAELQAVAEFEAGNKLHTEGKLAAAAEKFALVLSALPQSPEREDLRTIRRQSSVKLALVHFVNGRWPQAQSLFTQAIKLTSHTYRLSTGTMTGAKIESIIEQAELLHYSALCYYQSSELEEGELAIARALAIIAELPKNNSSNKENPRQQLLWSMKVTQARLLYASDSPQKRADSVQSMELIMNENDQYTPALIVYACIAIDRGLTLDVIPYLLRAIVNLSQAKQGKPNPKSGVASVALTNDLQSQCYERFIQMLSLSQGIETLMASLGQASTIPSSLSFLAQIVKDHSHTVAGIECSVQLYQRALSLTHRALVKDYTHLTLNLIHTLEISYQYERAFNIIKTFLSEKKAMKIGESVQLSNFATIINGVDTLSDNHEFMLGTSTTVPEFHRLEPLFDAGFSQVWVPNPTDSPSFRLGKHGQLVSGQLLKPYESEELDALAIVLTTVKLFYMHGILQPLPSMIELIEPLRKDKQLHLTMIRNEHAYYSTVAQIVQSSLSLSISVANVGERVGDNRSLIHVIGDSHCLSAGYQSLTIGGSVRTIKPWLVTGMKCWHMRANCKFYTKANFSAAMKQLEQTLASNTNTTTNTSALMDISTANIVIFIFGEIDCREGLLNAMETAKYESLEEAITLCVKIYINTVTTFIANNANTVAFIHPIIPVLDPTRKMVTRFNTELRNQLAVLANNGAVKIRYLDFFDDLTVSNGLFFNSVYGLDGTHLHPKYVKLIEREMNRIVGSDQLFRR